MLEEWKQGIGKAENDNILMMNMVNELNTKTQSIQWMHEELTGIKKRQMQILSLLNEQYKEDFNPD